MRGVQIPQTFHPASTVRRRPCEQAEGEVQTLVLRLTAERGPLGPLFAC